MTRFILSAISVISMFIGLLYCIVLAFKNKRKKLKMTVPIVTLLFGIISFVIPIYNSMDFSDAIRFDSNKTVSLNSNIYAYPDYPLTIRYTLDGTAPSKNSRLYTDEGIKVKKEDIQDDSLIIYYQIGIGESFYFSKVYTQEYKVSTAIELHPKSLSKPPEEKLAAIDERLVFYQLTIDGQKGSTEIIDGDILTKQEFQPSLTRYHTITFSKPNKNDFSKIYLYQQGITKLDIIIDDKYNYFCKFDSDSEKSHLFEIDFMENIPVQSSIKFEVYSSQNDYSISDIWFDYYFTQ